MTNDDDDNERRMTILDPTLPAPGTRVRIRDGSAVAHVIKQFRMPREKMLNPHGDEFGIEIAYVSNPTKAGTLISTMGATEFFRNWIRERYVKHLDVDLGSPRDGFNICVVRAVPDIGGETVANLWGVAIVYETENGERVLRVPIYDYLPIEQSGPLGDVNDIDADN